MFTQVMGRGVVEEMKKVAVVIEIKCVHMGISHGPELMIMRNAVNSSEDIETV